MQLFKLISTLTYTIVVGTIEKEISGVVFDSRNVKDGYVFVSHKGLTVDGHTFISKAIESGSTAIIGEYFSEENIEQAQKNEVTLIQVENSLHDGGIAIAAFYDFPANKMKMIGVTGTDGKTTTANLVYHLLKSQGVTVGLISTISAKIFNGTEEKENDTGFHVTTPEVVDVQRYLAEMVSVGCEYAVVEATSHGFAQERLAGINFDIGVVTNITHEHLDYHKTYDKYVLAKAQLFRRDPAVPGKVDRLQIALLNKDDHSWESLQPYVGNWDIVPYGKSDFVSIGFSNFSSSLHGATFLVGRKDSEGNFLEELTVESTLQGEYNAYNATAALGCVSLLGFSLESLLPALQKFPILPGRFEVVATGEGAHGTIIVDFAHTPHALEEVLRIGRAVTPGRLIVVFGCASERDVEKRPMMGKIAGEIADITILTAEDPRNESVDDINAQIISGLHLVGAENLPFDSIGELSSEAARISLSEHFPLYSSIPDRETAILTAVAISEKNDLVLVCGKGHEKSMCIGNVETPWSDQESVQRAVQKVG